MTSSQLPSLESNNHDFFSMLLEYLDGKDINRLNDEGVREEKQIHFTLNIDDNPTTDSENVDENPTTESENANVATNSLTIEGLGDINTNIQRYPSHTCEQIKGGYIWFVQLGPHPPIIAKSIIAVNCMNQRLT